MKSIFASKTIWLNAVTMVATGAGFFAGSLSSHPDLVCWLVLIQSLANVVLRLMTNTAIVVKNG
jgi:hypothetical protein